MKMYKPYCHCGNPTEGRTGQCATCNRLERKAATMRIPSDRTPIKKVSEKQARLLAMYNGKRKAWIRGKKCAVFKDRPAEDVHHIAGRSATAYYDEWARERDIPLLLDERFWLPVSREAHIEIEKRPEWAKRMGYSEDRLVHTRYE